ncbi:alpha/beta fold hydrolase [Aspergillus affinis]|uniref:alpha/beta fold hydrolase n=1 Tax=Aspergillus affinis TaxID=1070780 RepID=UPI0022FE74CD|nr:uncharacterized protein KD926_008992 [Aspergillus affinis]KAI9039891.1 hypothetical protein KD926_008992 [Aspergillus affinis]
MTFDSELFFQSHNPGHETILLIHGACGSSAEYKDVTSPLTKAGYHLLIPDLPAHGQSTHISPFTVEFAAEHLLQLIADHAHNGAAHVIGMSLGAHIAAHMAARARPGQILSLVATGYSTFRPPTFLIPLITVPIYALHHTLQLLFKPSVEIRQWSRGESSYALIAEVARTLMNPRVLQDIPVRTLVIAATKPTMGIADRTESAKWMFGVVVGGKENGSRVVQHRGVRHPWHVEEAAQFAEMVRRWVGGLELGEEFEDIE